MTGYKWRKAWIAFSALVAAGYLGYTVWLNDEVSDLGSAQREQGTRITKVERTINKQCRDVCKHQVALEVIRILNKRSTGVSGPGSPNGLEPGSRSSPGSGPPTGSDSLQPNQPSETPAGTPPSPTTPAPGDGGDQPNPPDGGGSDPGTGPGGEPPGEPTSNPLDDAQDIIRNTTQGVNDTIDDVQSVTCNAAPVLCQ